MNYVISNFTEYKFVLSENKKDVFQAHFTVLHCYDNLCTDYFERNLSFILDKKKNHFVWSGWWGGGQVSTWMYPVLRMQRQEVSQ